jgi:hypothetical protein
MTSRLLVLAFSVVAPALLFQMYAQAQGSHRLENGVDEAIQITSRAIKLRDQGQYDAAEPLFGRAMYEPSPFTRERCASGRKRWDRSTQMWPLA